MRWLGETETALAHGFFVIINSPPSFTILPKHFKQQQRQLLNGIRTVLKNRYYRFTICVQP